MKKLNLIKKRIIAPILLVSLLLWSLLGCEGLLVVQAPDIKEQIHNEYESMIDGLLDSDKISDLTALIVLWAETKGFTPLRDKTGNVIIEKEPEKGSDDLITFIADYSLENKEEDLRTLAFLMTLLTDFDSTYTIRAIFTPYRPDNYYGAKNLNQKFLAKENSLAFIHLNTKTPGTLTLKEADYTKVKVTKDIKTRLNSYNMAYDLRIEGLPSFSVLESGNATINPIKSLGDFFALLRTEGALLNISQLEGGFMDHANPYKSPTYASSLFAATENDQKSILKNFNKLRQQIIKDLSAEYPEVTISLIENEELPDRVLAFEDNDRIISFLYTIHEGGLVNKDFGLSYIKSINLDSKIFSSEIEFRTVSDDSLETLIDNLAITADLYDMKYSLSATTRGWVLDEEDNIAAAFLKATKKEEGISLSPSSLTVINSRRQGLKLMSFGINLKDCEKQWTILLDASRNFVPD